MVATSATSNGLSCLLGEVDAPLILKVRSSEHQGRILRIRSPKCTIGSHANCTLRLLCARVRPFHCMILRGRAGMFIRRLSRSTSLNGAGFSESWLKAGDFLNLGPIELEVLSSVTGEDQQGNGPSAGERGVATSTPNRIRDAAHHTSGSPDPTFHGGDVSAPPDDHRRAVELEPAELEPAEANARCQQCRQERQHLESVLTTHVEENNQHRDALVQQCNELKSELKQSRSAWRRVAGKAEASPQAGVQEQVTYRDLIGSLREELGQLKDQYAAQLVEQDRLLTHVSTVEQDRVGLKVAHQKAVAENHKQVEQSRELRRQLDESLGKLLASKNRTTELQSQLEQAREQVRQTSDSEHRLREEISQLHEQLEATLAELEAERAEDEPADQTLQADKKTNATEIAKWREVAEGVRKELRQERESHQRVRGEWHLERENLRKELAQRSTTLRELQKAYDELVRENERATQEAESLILSQQQEGQQLLTQLHEAKQALRQAEREWIRLQECQGEQTEPDREHTDTLTTELAEDACGNPTELDQPTAADAATLQRVSAADWLPEEEIESGNRDQSHYTGRGTTSGAVNEANSSASEKRGECDGPAGRPEPENVEQPATGQTVAMPWSQLPEQVKLQVLEHDNEAPLTQSLEGLEPRDFAGQTSAGQQKKTFQTREQTAFPPANAGGLHQDDPAVEDHEGFMQQYMDRLLKRTATPEAPKPAACDQSHWPSVVSTANECRNTVPETTAQDAPVELPSSSSTQTAASQHEPSAEQGSTQRRGKTETPTDLIKMREVANTTSREAIQHCESKKLIARSLRPLLAASALMLFGGAMITKSSSMLGLQAVAGGFALAAGAALVLLAGLNYHRWRRVTRFRTDSTTTTRT